MTVAGKEGVFSDTNSDNKNDKITVTLRLDDIKDQYGDVQTNPNLVVDYKALANTTVSDGTEFASGTKLEFSNLGTNYSATKAITVKNGTSSTGYSYTLEVVIPKSDDTSVLFASIGGVEATVSGSAISAVLEKNADLTQVELVFQVAKGATVKANGISFTPDTANAAYDKFTSSTKVDLSSAKTVVVTAADGTASKQYSVSATNASEASDAVLTSFSLKDPDGNTYTTSIDQSKKVITTAKIPYMTTDITDWVMYATFSSGAKVVYDGNTVINGQTKFTGSDVTGWSDGEGKTLTNTVKVVSLADSSVFTEYTLKVTFQAASTDKTLKSLTVTAQDITTDSLSDQQMLRAMTDANTYDAKIDATNKSIKVETAYSHSTLSKYITAVSTNGGVPFAYDGSNVYRLTIPSKDNTVANTAVELADSNKIIVLPEVVAKKYVEQMNTGSTNQATFTSGDEALGTVYTASITNVEASTEGLLKTLKVGDTTLQVGAGSGKITGTIPYSMTIDSSKLSGVTADKANYVNFTISDYAALKTTADSTKYTFISGGDKDLDGEPDATPADENAKLVFVRGANNTVTVYVYGAAVDDTNTLTSLDVYAESDLTGTAANSYKFELKYANANTGADMTSFKLGNTSGSINGTTINVTVPFGTELKALIPTFSLSTGATAYVDGVKLESGKTVLNCTNDIKITVLSEDEKTSKVYTVKVTVADQFTDVNENDWFYENVMRAVELGILSGKGNGIFAPNENITRRDFAIMLAQALGHSNSEPATSPFKDVADNDYGVSSIAYLYEQGITAGDDKGNFNPDANITRQEAATMLAKAFEATGTSTELYTDDAKIADWAKGFVYACKDAGLMSGDVAGTFRPTDTLTRAEAASAMVNAVDN